MTATFSRNAAYTILAPQNKSEFLLFHTENTLPAPACYAAIISNKKGTFILRMFWLWADSGVEKVSDHGTIGPRKYFGSQKETGHT